MKIVKTVDEVRVIVKEWKKEGLTVGLVPTMGFLHEGHKSLITRAVSENDTVVVSDFVNPTQFGVGEDLESYPRDLERDTMLCEEAGANLIFNPEPENMYFDCLEEGIRIGEKNSTNGMAVLEKKRQKKSKVKRKGRSDALD